MPLPRLHWTRGRTEKNAGLARAVEWVGLDDAGEAIARVVRLQGPLWRNWRQYRAVALDEEAKVVELRPTPPDGADWLACVGGKVVGRAALPLQAVRAVEAVLEGIRAPWLVGGEAAPRLRWVPAEGKMPAGRRGGSEDKSGA